MELVAAYYLAELVVAYYLAEPVAACCPAAVVAAVHLPELGTKWLVYHLVLAEQYARYRRR